MTSETVYQGTTILAQTITIQDGVTATNKYDYAPEGNIIREYKPTNAVASVARYTYDGVCNTLTMTTGLSSLTDNTTAYTYNTNGYRATLIYANGVVESYQYNKASHGRGDRMYLWHRRNEPPFPPCIAAVFALFSLQ